MSDDSSRAGERSAEPEAEPAQREPLEAPRGVLLVLRGTDQAVELSAARPVISVGRVEGNDLVIPMDNVSRRQVRFMFEGGAVYAEDLLSAGGTYLDGRKLSSRTRLGRGAVVSFGNHEIELVER